MARLPLYGTAAVTAGMTTVTWTGDILTGINCNEGFEVVIEGRTNFVNSLTDTTHFELAMPHSGAGGTGLPAAINPITDAEKSTAELNARVARLLSNLDLTDANGRGVYQSYVADSDGDPGVGNFSFDNASLGSATHMYLSLTDENNQSVADLLGLFATGTVLIARSLDTMDFARVTVVGKTTFSTYVDLTVSVLSVSGTLAEDEPCAIEWNRIGDTNSGLEVDARVANIAARAAYNAEATGFAVLVQDTGEALPRSAIYYKNSGTSGDWSTAFYVTGNQGPGGLHVALSDEVTIISAGTNKLRMRQVGNLTITGVRASLNVASSSGVVTVDINVNGSSILNTKLTIDANEKSSLTAAIAAVLNTSSIADDAEIEFDIDTAGVGAIGLKVSILGKTA